MEEDLKGKTINGLKVIERLGKGGFGIVYLVQDIMPNNERYAVKMMRKEKRDSKYSLEYEYTILKVLDCPYIVKLIDYFVYKNEFFCLQMEYCEAGSLTDIIRINKEKETTIDYKDTFKWSKEIINGLYYLHSNKTIHRDVKPANVLLTKEKNAKLADFGLSRMIDFDFPLSDNTNCLTPIGTHQYKSPEMRKGKEYDYKTDIWSAGCVIYELIALEKFADIESNRQLNKKIPQQLIELMKSMLVKDQYQRCDSTTLKKNLDKLEENIMDMAEITYKDLIYNQILPRSSLSTRNQNFIGRIENLGEIDRAFTIEKKQIIILSSISGTGKSSIANEIGHRFNERSLSQFVYWMKSDEDNLDEQFRKFAFDLKLINDEKLRESTEYVMNKIGLKLKSDHLSEQFLFILHNCDSIEKTNKYFDFIIQDSALTNIKFLITTEISSPLDQLDSRIKKNSLNIIIYPFKKEESSSFIRCNLKNLITDSNKLNEVIKLFEISDERPVILNNIIALVKSKVQSTSDLNLFIEDLKHNPRKLDSLENELFENLIVKEEKAWRVLKHSSFLDPDFIPDSIYTNLFKIETDEFCDAKDVLIETLLVKEEKDDEGMEFGIRIHRTLQNKVMQYLTNNENENRDNEFEELLKNSYENIKFIFENKIESNEWNNQKYYKNFKKMIDHLLINKNLGNEKKGKLSFDFATYSRETDLGIRNSLHYNKKSLVFYRKEFKTFEHILIAKSISGIANACSNLGRYEEALKNYENSMKICQNLSKTDENSSIAIIAYNMALVYGNLGRHDEALKNYEKSLAIYRKIHENDDYLPIALNLTGIGNTFRILDRNKEALTSLEKSLKICQKVFLTEEDPSIANILQNIALIYSKEGKYEEAIANLKESIRIYEKIYGSDKHSHVALAQNNIADIYKTLGRYDEALSSFEKSLEINRIIYGTDVHLFIAGNLNNIGDVNRILGRNHQALVNYQQSLKISRKLFENDDHHSIAVPLNNIGLIYHIFNRHDEALINFESSLAIYRKIFRTDENSLSAQILVNIASVYYRQKKYQEALFNFEKSIEIHRKISGTNEDDLVIAASLHNIGLIYLEQQIYDKALDNFHKSLDINLHLLGTSETVTISTIFENIARTHDFSGRHEEALVYLETSLDIRRKIFKTDDHPLIALSYNNLAVVYRSLKNYKEALNCMFKFLKIIGNLVTNLKLNLSSTKPYDENSLD